MQIVKTPVYMSSLEAYNAPKVFYTTRRVSSTKQLQPFLRVFIFCTGSPYTSDEVRRHFIVPLRPYSSPVSRGQEFPLSNPSSLSFLYDLLEG